MSATHFIVKITHTCNLQCNYCYLRHNKPRETSFMAGETFSNCLDAALRNARAENLKKINIILHGGEPLLLGITRISDYLDRVRTLEKQYGISIVLGLQTNGLLLDDEYIALLKKGQFNIGLSLDGPEHVHNAHRLTKTGRGSFEVVIKNLKKALDAGLDPGILAVVQPDVMGDEVYSFFEQTGIKRISFLLPAQNHAAPVFPSDEKHTPVADYLIRAFDSWLNSSRQDVHVYLFEATIRAIYEKSEGIPVIGSPPAEWISFTPDGAVEAGDCYGICNAETVFRDDPLDAIHLCEQSEIYQLQKKGGTLPNALQCRECCYADICRGGFLPHRYSASNGYDNPSYYCHDLKRYFAHVIQRLKAVDKEFAR